MDSPGSQKKVLLIDNDISIRFVIKKLLNNILINSRIYSSDKGPEGLGLAYIVKPNIIILDTTLPRYSGREVVDFIVTNKIFTNTKVVLLQENNDFSLKWSLNYIVLSKTDVNFTDILLNIVKTDFEHKEEGAIYKLSLFLGKRVIKFSNSSDNNTTQIDTNPDYLKKIHHVLAYFINQLVTTFYLFLFLILVGRKDLQEDLSDDKDEFSSFRSNVYSKFIGAVSFLTIVIAMVIIISLSQ